MGESFSNGEDPLAITMFSVVVVVVVVIVVIVIIIIVKQASGWRGRLFSHYFVLYYCYCCCCYHHYYCCYHHCKGGQWEKAFPNGKDPLAITIYNFLLILFIFFFPIRFYPSLSLSRNDSQRRKTQE